MCILWRRIRRLRRSWLAKWDQLDKSVNSVTLFANWPRSEKWKTTIEKLLLLLYVQHIYNTLENARLSTRSYTAVLLSVRNIFNFFDAHCRVTATKNRKYMINYGCLFVALNLCRIRSKGYNSVPEIISFISFNPSCAIYFAGKDKL